MSNATLKKGVSDMFKAAQKSNLESVEDVVPQEFATMEDTEKTLMKMESKIETTKNEGENILSRLRAGIISQDVAKKQMKSLLTQQCGELMGVLMRYKGIAPDISVTEEQIEKALLKVNTQLS